MKTEMRKVFVSVRAWTGVMRNCGTDLVASLDKPESTDSAFYAHICEAEVAVPVLSDDEIVQLLAGAEIEAIHKAKEQLQARTHQQLKAYDERLGELTAIENKG